jgi:hypothetical protein
MEIIREKIKAPAACAAAAALWMAALVLSGCSDAGAPAAAPDGTGVATDQDLFRLITTEAPYTAYPLFPGVDSVTSGTLNGSSAHQPLVRVSLNATALSSLTADTLPAGRAFAEGSVIVKEIRQQNVTTLLAVMLKDPANTSASGGWLWAEYTPEGGVVFSIGRRGDGCVPCHARERGPDNDLVRTFERRLP